LLGVGGIIKIAQINFFKAEIKKDKDPIDDS
jgi:hypothetical protein